MCIVIYKPIGASVPVKHLENSWENNSEGAGFMFPADGKVQGYKGFMTYDELYLAMDNLGFIKNNQVICEVDLVIHFRFATHGGVSAGKTHPFPASRDDKELHTETWQHSHGIAHNGVVSQYAETGLSDTQGFIKAVLSDEDILAKLSHDEDIVFLLKHLTAGSKFLIMSRDNITMLGEWKLDNGVYYSNTGYQKTYNWQTVNYSYSGKSQNKHIAPKKSYLNDEFDAAYYGDCDLCKQPDYLDNSGVCAYCHEEGESEDYCQVCGSGVKDIVFYKHQAYCLECFKDFYYYMED